VQTCQEDKFFRLLLLEDGVAVAVPRGSHRFGPIIVEELLQNFLPAEFAHDVFIELCPIVAQQFLEARKSYGGRSFTGPVERRMENLLGRYGWLLEHARQSGPAGILQDGCRESKSTNIGKDQRVFEEGWRSLQSRSAAQIANQHGRIELRDIF